MVQSDVRATDQTPNVNDLIDQAKQRINAANQGTYGEGRISQGVNEFKNLEDQVQKGQISQKDYLAATSALKDQLGSIMNPLLQGGHASASAANAAGANDLSTKYFRNADIYKAAQDTLGRDLTSNEFAQVAPLFGSGSDKEVEAGRAALAQIASNDQQGPSGVSQKYQQGQSGYNDQVNGVFNSLLQRGASQDELDHFGKMIASGDVDPYTLSQFVQQLPEYRTNQSNAAAATQTQADTAARSQLSDELQGYDQNFFNKAKEDVISRYTQAGIQNSPSLDFALTNLMGDIQKQRSAYLADVARQDYVSERGNTRQDYLNNNDLLRQDYMTNLGQLSNNANYSRQRSDQLSDLMRGRSYDVADYQTQQNNLMNLLSQQQQPRRGGFGSALGPLIGAGIGAAGAGMVSGGMGAGAGAQLGAYLGGAGGGAYDYMKY